MYFPYLRSNANEVLAVLELAPKLVPNSLVLPVFNVVKVNDVFEGRIRKVCEIGLRVCILTNTGSIDHAPDLYDFLDSLEGDYPGIVFPGFEIKDGVTGASLKGFAKRFSKASTLIVHRKSFPAIDVALALKSLKVPSIHAYISSALPAARAHGAPSSGDVIIRDGFAKAARNGDYPEYSNFPSEFGTYLADGYAGFGDFAAIGDHYKVGGGRASNVALHLTERRGAVIRCNHFVSDDIHTRSHVHVQYEDALQKLVDYVEDPPKIIFRTEGVIDGYLADSEYHGLGVPKRWSLKHHLEMMENTLIGKAVRPFI